MIGLIFAFLTAVFRFFADVISKISLDGSEEIKDIDPLTTSVFYRLTGVPVLLFFVLVIGIPSVSTEYFLVLIVSVPASVVATILYMKALNHSDISLVSPIKSMSPVLVIITGFLILGELPGLLGGLGVLFVLFGVYVLEIGHISKSLLAPIKEISSDKGVQIVFVIMVIYSITAPLDKIGVQASSPALYALSLYTGSSMGLLIYHRIKVGSFDINRQELKRLSYIGFFNGLSSLTQMLAFSLTLVVYVVSIKRLATLFNSIYGTLILKEGMAGARILGSLTIVVGAILIGLETA